MFILLVCLSVVVALTLYTLLGVTVALVLILLVPLIEFLLTTVHVPSAEISDIRKCSSRVSLPSQPWFILYRWHWLKGRNN